MSEESLVIWLQSHYPFEGEIHIKLLRAYTNDVYLVTAPQAKFILKLYPLVWRTTSEIVWEIDLVNYVVDKGFHAAKVVPSLTGEQLLSYSEAGKTMSAVVFEYATGSKPTPPFSPELYERVGKAAATFHEISNGFRPRESRPDINLDYLIDDSLAVLKRYVPLDDYQFFYNFGSRLKTKINHFIKSGLDWGPVHGDVTMDNLHVADDGTITFYDFDSAGFGWRAMELQGWVVLSPDKQKNIDAYLTGYRSVRQISENNIQAAPYLQAAQDMWLREGMKALQDKAILNDQLQRIKTWSDYFGNSI